jgi:NifU-like protein involved in Fe-S cluster formation
MWLQIADGRIEKASYKTHGCPSSAAAAGMTVTLVTGRTLEQANLITPGDVKTVLGGLPEGKGHFADMAIESLKKALDTKL